MFPGPTRGTARQITTLRGPWNRVRKLPARGKAMVVCFVLSVLCFYSFTLLKIATSSSSAASTVGGADDLKKNKKKNGASAAVHGPDRLMNKGEGFLDDDADDIEDDDDIGDYDIGEDDLVSSDMKPRLQCTLQYRIPTPELPVPAVAADEGENEDGKKKKKKQPPPPPAEVGSTIPLFSAEIVDGCYKDRSDRSVACLFHNLIVDTSKITLKASGGEPLDTVMGQKEEDELVQNYQEGAFLLRPNSDYTPSIPKLLVGRPLHYDGSEVETLYFLRPVIASMKKRAPHMLKGVVAGTDDARCTKQNIVETPTLFLTRYDYVNLKNTLADMFSAYGVSFAALPPGKQRDEAKFNVVFLDAHPQGEFDEVWQAIFGGTVTYVKQMDQLLPSGNDTGGNNKDASSACFQKAVFVPSGNNAPIQSSHCQSVPFIMDGFVHRILASYNLGQVKRVKRKIVIIERVFYVPHPRKDVKNKLVSRYVSNFSDLRKALIKELSPSGKVDVEIVHPESLGFRRQVELMRSAEIIIGMTGSGQSNMIFMDQDTLSLELDPFYDSPYESLAQWKGMGHTHMGITTNMFEDLDQPKPSDNDTEKRRIDTSTIEKIVEIAKVKVTCNLFDGNVVTVNFDELLCQQKPYLDGIVESE